MRSGLAAAAALLLGACASLPAATGVDPAATRGRDYAVANCSGCHAVGLKGASPLRAAPAFRGFRQDWEPLALGLRLERSPIHSGPDMVSRYMTQAELEDMAAYLRLTRAGRSPGPPVYAGPRCSPTYWC